MRTNLPGGTVSCSFLYVYFSSLLRKTNHHVFFCQKIVFSPSNPFPSVLALFHEDIDGDDVVGLHTPEGTG
jgi:hypothetical protein